RIVLERQVHRRRAYADEVVVVVPELEHARLVRIVEYGGGVDDPDRALAVEPHDTVLVRVRDQREEHGRVAGQELDPLRLRDRVFLQGPEGHRAVRDGRGRVM